ncbi:hypothetical protein T07_4211 [Trichinella nelsoni]|uniref:Uncharacterized protein n=1 Tax=Trichinella nelsoni TaxID=6336 RepID=A0A0V0SAW1_9BILA|nr:hypothetical protein T07_4211 [Trichinella nelsoni]
MGSPCRTPWLISILLRNTPPSPLITVVHPVTTSHMSARESVSNPSIFKPPRYNLAEEPVYI